MELETAMDSEQKTEGDRLVGLIESLLDANGFELVDLELHRGKRMILRLYIDRIHSDETVTISDCSKVSRLLGPAIEVEELLDGAYVLEVSSPGVDRPLKKAKDFIRFRGQPARLSTKDAVDGRTFFQGTIAEANLETVTIDVSGEWIEIPYANVTKANLEFQFGSSRR
jgi:ribosome maturation factor RimP